MKSRIAAAARLLSAIAALAIAGAAVGAEIRIRSDEWLPYNGPSFF